MNFDLILESGKAKLSESLIKLLSAKVGDRIVIEYGNKDGILMPVISISPSGNLLSKSNTIVCRGKDKDFLAQYGDNFTAIVESGVIFLQGDHEFKVYTNVKKAVNENYLDLSITTDTNYNIQKFENYKV